VRPIASVRRKHGGVSNSIGNEEFEDNVEHEEVEIEDESYPGGPANKSLLINYEDHMV